MNIQVADKFRTGLAPQAFIHSMQKNQESFIGWQQQFQWESAEDEDFFQSMQNRDDIRCLIIAADWCGDVIRNVPVVFRALEHSGIPVEVLIMEQHLELIDQFLTMGGRAIPIVIFADTGGFVLGHWGPRPSNVQAVMTKFKQANPDRDAADYQAKIQVARAEMMAQYGEGTSYQATIVRELRALLSTF